MFTDEERQMQDRVWRFVVAPHARAWMFDRSLRPQRQAVPMLMQENFDPAAYFVYLKAQDYRSSTVRYAIVAGDIEADLATLPETFDAICAVEEMSGRRRIALAEISPDDAAVAAALRAREADNDAFFAWFARALAARERAYALALDSMLIETPHQGSRAVNDGLNRLAPWTARAARGDFCPPPVQPQADATLGFGMPAGGEGGGFGGAAPRRLYSAPEVLK
ncbi:MAG TPA: hypothetical protein VMW31_04780 [Devosiaceae bacterium]|nr:hypothetical protein [Devosiaceae bacterium]